VTDISLFDYRLPPALIAQAPASPRDASRLLRLDRRTGRLEDRRFHELPGLLRPGDCLVWNDSRVIPARLRVTLPDGGPPGEVLLLREVGPSRWEAMVRPGRRFRPGVKLELAGGAAGAVVLARTPAGTRVLAIEAEGPVIELLERHGLPPLPPYILRHRAPDAEDRQRYQTVYARDPGSVAAPTAGLHVTSELIARLRERAVQIHAITLHVGPGTFRPMAAQTVEEHRMDGERVTVPRATAEAVSRAKAEGRRVVAVGTTTTRALEWAAAAGRAAEGVSGTADLFIRPGHRFRVVDVLVTNFHLPRSTLLVLVSALAGRETILAAYAHAVRERYRFYSYGDAMLIE
jgi:S-adenosylmethionine:tRNA ribosyltransferase-isomerase